MAILNPRLAASAALILLLTAPAALAQNKPAKPAASEGASLLPGGNSREPINIAADKLDYFDKQQKAIYTGNVVAVQGETRLNATALTIFFEKKPEADAAGKPEAKADSKPDSKAAGPGGGSQMRRMEGKGPIVLSNKDQVGVGDSLVFDKPQNKFYLIGNVALSQGENVTRGDQLIYDLASGQAVVTSKGRVRSLIVPGDQKPAPGAKPGR
jgi:lipopolysaccharide export system protein LptA